MLYGLYIFSSAVAGDLTQALSESIFNPKTTIQIDQSKTTDVNDLPPIVLVHGIFGFGKGRLGCLSYFAGAENKDERVLVPNLGSLTSVHDRARDLFYYLKGGRVDYGEEHSKACGHSQFGVFCEKGEYQERDEDHPIHFVGHSAGAQVVRVLQQMLADKMFKGYENTNENWVLSLTSFVGSIKWDYPHLPRWNSAGGREVPETYISASDLQAWSHNLLLSKAAMKGQPISLDEAKPIITGLSALIARCTLRHSYYSDDYEISHPIP